MNCLKFFSNPLFCFFLINLTDAGDSLNWNDYIQKKSHTAHNYINYRDEIRRKKHNHFSDKLSDERTAIDKRLPLTKVAAFSLLHDPIAFPPSKNSHTGNSFSKVPHDASSRPHNRKDILKSLLEAHIVHPNFFLSGLGGSTRNSKNAQPESTANKIASSLEASGLEGKEKFHVVLGVLFFCCLHTFCMWGCSQVILVLKG